MHHALQVGLIIFVWLLVGGGLCWAANWIFPTSVPRVPIYIGIFIALLALGGAFRGFLLP